MPKAGIVAGMDLRGIPYELVVLGYNYDRGPEGVGAWTKRRNEDGFFISFFLVPAGKGSRTRDGGSWYDRNWPEYYKFSPRLTTKRRSRKAAIDRAHNLAYGKAVNHGHETREMAKLPGRGYCMKEKKSVLVDWTGTKLAKNGRQMIVGECPDCGTTIQKYGQLIDCGGCDERREAKAGDYLCVFCRFEEANPSELQ